MVRLYELSNDYEDLLDELEETGGELTPEMESRLESLEEALPAKVENCCMVIRTLETEAVAITAELDRLKRAVAVRENGVKRLRDYLKGNLERMETPKVKTPLFSVSVQKSPPSIRWLGPVEELPERFKRVRVELDAKAALAEFKDGGQLCAGFEVERGTHLRIN